ncbi:DUF6519 domain-containing protein [Jidongwangia harbinensis]|uniref:DUF6519 domain-containing protein n=1 Tax=Jidongwangia harbinensis TaxID=2878561 RepID=UPI001CD9E419|nr:DUF6519 domain-containing protein [Jidongwangia harbinensis]MCA2218025.1 DUF4815 domain-containing protein [Jidongwangia harbinensis]
MYGDFSRLTFRPDRHFSAVLSQQGRVQLDADANENTAVLLHQMRTLAADLIGPWGAPELHGGFDIRVVEEKGQITDLTVSPGRMWVGGVLVENAAEARYHDQPYALFDPKDADDQLPPPPFTVVLRVFERTVTAVEDPAIREVALGDDGPDTCVRTEVVWQVTATTVNPAGDALGDASKDDVKQGWPGWEEKALAALGKLEARAFAAPSTDPCVLDPAARYRGEENQLYRVEMHSPTTFTWSRENGSVVFPIITMGGKQATVTSLGRDDRLGLQLGDLVEVIDDRSVRAGHREPLLRVLDIDRLDGVVRFATAPTTTTGQDPALHPFLRRWDHHEPRQPGDAALAADNTLTVDTKDWINLEDGVQIRFEGGEKLVRRPGDHWLIPARTATGDVEWPKDTFLPPFGIRYYTAPLALIRGTKLEDRDDLREIFKSFFQS